MDTPAVNIWTPQIPAILSAWTHLKSKISRFIIGGGPEGVQLQKDAALRQKIYTTVL